MAQKKKENATPDAERMREQREVEADPQAEERKPWTEGNTKIHRLPVSVRVQVDEMLASRRTVSRVLAWLQKQGQDTDAQSGKPITESDLYYYRERYITYHKMMGEALISRFQNWLGVNIDPLLTVQAAVGVQMKRLQMSLDEEKDAGVTMPETGEELDRLDRLCARAFRMMQDLGLLPRAPIKSEVKQELSGSVETTQTQRVEVTDDEADLFKEALRRATREVAQQMERQEAGGDEEAPDDEGDADETGDVASDETGDTASDETGDIEDA